MDIRDILESKEFANVLSLEDFFTKDVEGGMKSNTPYKKIYFDNEEGFKEIIERELKAKNTVYGKSFKNDLKKRIKGTIKNHNKANSEINPEIRDIADRFIKWINQPLTKIEDEKELYFLDLIKEEFKSRENELYDILLMKNPKSDNSWEKPFITDDKNWIGKKYGAKLFFNSLELHGILKSGITKTNEGSKAFHNTFKPLSSTCMDTTIGNDEGEIKSYFDQEIAKFLSK